MDKSLEKRIGTAARKARVSHAMTQEDAAEQIGVSVEFYSRIERGKALPSLKTLIRMAVVFGVSADTLIGFADNEEAQRLIREYSAPPPDDPPELKRLMRRLRGESIDGVRFVANFVNTILNEMERKVAEVEAKPDPESESAAGDPESESAAGETPDDSDEPAVQGGSDDEQG